jgi:hypothetical protein
LTKKRQVSLKPSRVHRSRENINSAKNKSNISAHENPIQLSAIREEENDGAVKQWLAERLRDKLQRASILSFHNHKPILLYRKSIEENENATEEEISYVSGNQIVHMIYVYGGFIPSSFQVIDVFTLDKFTKWIVQNKRKDLLLQCLEELDQ